MNKPMLSIIVPMRGGVPEVWLRELLKVEGSVEFILVYPPGVSTLSINDSRLLIITNPLKGELIQRITALLNATGTYVLSINCDEYLHPNIVKITEEYFERFPDSYYFRLQQAGFAFGDPAITQEWKPLPKIEDVKVRITRKHNQEPKKDEPNYSEAEIKSMMRDIPIAPLDNKFDFLVLLRGRRDHHGAHHENFDKKVWKNQIVQEALKDVVTTFQLLGPLKYIPFWTADRLLGLYIQAKFFEKGKIMGHWLPIPEQLRTEGNPPEYAMNNRRYGLAEVLLLKHYPNYGYFWNLVLSKNTLFSLFLPVDTIKIFANFIIKLRNRVLPVLKREQI
ncbi:transposase [Planktothrix mougeotii]|uniref:Transposase n=1 Tax=Planktothrix mougeotii LEGE 06226 TaxID=1828728 RepID=A0ABR9UAL3_9CYAN|nr:transposase [Planktothrix mougeotii]MBE9143472.1 transposase [Planktothrix mougeotii LEGE 06226]